VILFVASLKHFTILPVEVTLDFIGLSVTHKVFLNPPPPKKNYKVDSFLWNFLLFLNVLKTLERRKSNSFVIYKYSFCCPHFCPLHSPALGGRTTPPTPPAKPLRTAKVS
jgi:hypothetical protein